jgi:hypothetical protein
MEDPVTGSKRKRAPTQRLNPSDADLERVAKGRLKSCKSQALHYFASRFQDAIHVPASIHGNAIFIDGLQVVKNLYEVKDELYGDFVNAFERLLQFYLGQSSVVAAFILFDIPTLVPKAKQQEQKDRVKSTGSAAVFSDLITEPDDVVFARTKSVPLHFQHLMDDRSGFRIPFLEWLANEILGSEELTEFQPKWFGVSGPAPVLQTSLGAIYELNHGEADIQAFYLARFFKFQSMEFVSTDTDTMYYGLLHVIWGNSPPSLPSSSGTLNEEVKMIWSYHKRFLTWSFGHGNIPKRIWPEWEDSRMDVTKFASLLRQRGIEPANVVVAALVGGSDYTTGNLYLPHERVFNALLTYPRHIGNLVDGERELDMAGVRRLITCAFFAAAYAERKNAKTKQHPTVDVRFLQYPDLFRALEGKGIHKYLISEKTLDLRLKQLDHYWRIMRSLHSPRIPEMKMEDYGFHMVNGIWVRMY